MRFGGTRLLTSFGDAEVAAGGSTLALLRRNGTGGASFHFTAALSDAGGQRAFTGDLGNVNSPFLTNLHVNVPEAATGTLPAPGSLALAAPGLARGARGNRRPRFEPADPSGRSRRPPDAGRSRAAWRSVPRHGPGR